MRHANIFHAHAKVKHCFLLAHEVSSLERLAVVLTWFLIKELIGFAID